MLPSAIEGDPGTGCIPAGGLVKDAWLWRVPVLALDEWLKRSCRVSKSFRVNERPHGQAYGFSFVSAPSFQHSFYHSVPNGATDECANAVGDAHAG